MIFNFDDKNTNTDISADICIIGAGAAGISLALEFEDTNYTVAIIESGGYKVSRKNQSLNKVKSIGATYSSLEVQRGRFLGGTTNFWGGNCIPLDPLDFKKSNARKTSSWPFSYESLNTYILRAQKLLNIPTKFGDELLKIIKINNKADLAERFEWKAWQFCKFPFRFGEIFLDRLKKSKNIAVYLNVNLYGFVASKNGAIAEKAIIKSLSGKNGEVIATRYVIATGGIENSRILLNMQKNNNFKGLKENDAVGRNFAEHPNATIGYIEGPGAEELYQKHKIRYLHDGREVKPGLGVTEIFQQDNANLNGIVSIWPLPDENNIINRAKLLKGLLRNKEFGLKFLINSFLIIPNLASLLPHVRHRLRGDKIETPYRKDRYEVRLMTETSPNWDSRVKLNSKVDKLGMLKVDVDWQLTDQDRASFYNIAKKAKEYLEETNEVKLHFQSWIGDNSIDWSKYINTGGHFGHHMGTTKMSHDDIPGVVDKNCKVESIDNIYIAGSSVFPTYGFANPTLTIVALAIKLADHFKKKDSKFLES